MTFDESGSGRAYPDNPWMLLALGDVCLRLGERESARAYFAAGVELASRGSDADVLALLHKGLASL